MIVVRVELWSARDGRVTELARMHVANVSKHSSPSVGDYTGAVLRRPKFESITRKGTVMNHRRLALPVWTLIGKMLAQMGYV